MTVPVSDASIYEGIRRLMSTPTHTLSSTLHCIDPDRSISHLIYFTAGVQPEQLVQLEQLHADRITVISVNANEEDAAYFQRTAVAFPQLELCPVSPGCVGAALREVIL